MPRRLRTQKDRRSRGWRIIRNLSLAILCWFAALGVCLFVYDQYLKFVNYPYFLGGRIHVLGGQLRPHD